MDKLQHYAAKLQVNKQKALEEIKNLESAGFVVPESVKQRASSPTPNRITQATYKREMIGLNKHRIRSTARLVVDEVYHPTNPTYDIKANVTTDVKFSSLKGDVNKALKDSKPNERLNNIIRLVVVKAGVPQNQWAGLETDTFKIDNEYDPTKPYTLSQHIQFKQVTPTLAKEIMKTPFANEAVYEAFEEAAAHRGYMKNVQKITGLDPVQIDTLESVMNSSSAWTIAKRNAQDSNQVLENWTHLYNKLADSQNDIEDSDFDKIVTMIDNEDPLSSIIRSVDDIMTAYMKG